MMNGANSLINKIPKVKRCRDYHVYDFNGRRFFDMYLDGGRAFLGHKPGRTLLMMKNCLDKGLSAAYPGVWEKRLLNQLQSLYPSIAACSIVFGGGETYYVFRPFESEQPPENTIFELLLPMPGSSIVKVVCAADSCKKELPENDLIPQYLYSGLCRAAAELAAAKKNLKDDTWSFFDFSFWKRQGPWLYPTVSEDAYKNIFSTLLKKGVIISPYYEQPSCAPSQFSEGEILPIVELAKEFC
ncbi:MAG: hypothetical protein PQJ46_12255 [Spirochaetales bacterium]|nr:hypothetical protein [Spirochaetales bacterium]